MPTKDELLKQREAINAQLAEIEEREHKAAMKGDMASLIAIVAAVRFGIRRANQIAPNTFSGERWEIPQQAYPRSGKFAKAGDLTKDDVDKAKAKGEKAIEGL